ncbi:MAG: hypothetical protein GX575_33585 [Candidatus Anammoximicrobium sp.]|nr:hypothetical protein [Candidatus Anammoximicrobium sp.]
MLNGDLQSFWRIGQTLATVLLLSGCSVLDTGSGQNLPLPDAAAIAAPGATASITMEIRPAGKKPQMTQVQLDNGTTIQQALEKANLTKRFRRMNIQLLRVAGEQRAKLDVKYEHTKTQVNPLYDYALHPGDHLIVTQDTATALDDMLESISPLR